MCKLPPAKDFRGGFDHKSGGPVRILVQEVSASVSLRSTASIAVRDFQQGQCTGTS